MVNTRKRKQSKDDSPFPAPTSTSTAQATPRMGTRSKSAPKKEGDAATAPQLGSPFENAPRREQGDAKHPQTPAPAPNDAYMRHHTANLRSTSTVGPEIGTGSPHDGPSVYVSSNDYEVYRRHSQSFSGVGRYDQRQQASFARQPLDMHDMSWMSPSSFNMTASPTPTSNTFSAQTHGLAPVPTGDISGISGRGIAAGGPTLTSTEQGGGFQQNVLRAEAPASVPRYIGGSSGQPLQQTPKRASQAEVAGGPVFARQPHRNVFQQVLSGQNPSVFPQEEVNGALAMQQWIGANHPPPSQLPQRRPPMDISKRRILDSEGARQFLNHVSWRPISKSHGVPRTEEDRLPYVKKIYDALVDTDDVWDIFEWPQDTRRFDRVEGVWGHDARVLEAISHQVVDVCIKIHNHGVTGLDIALFPAMQKTQQQDICFQFAQRIHFMALMLRHFKCKANQVMLSVFQIQYLARIWSELRDLKEFWYYWMSKTEAWRNEQMNVAPFEDVSAVNMTHEEEKQALMEAHQQGLLIQQQNLQHQKQIQRQMQDQGGMKRPIAAVENPSGTPAEKRQAVEGQSSQARTVPPSLFGPFPTQQQLVGQGQVKPPETGDSVELDAPDFGPEAHESGNDGPDWDALFGDDGEGDAPVDTQEQVHGNGQDQSSVKDHEKGLGEKGGR